jgi:hypothetical protein
MSGAWRRLALALAVASLSVVVIAAEPAQANPVEVVSGQVTFSGDDWITGHSYSFSTAKGDTFIATYLPYNPVYQAPSALNLQFGMWDLQLGAPLGQELGVGAYTGATGPPFYGWTPGIDLFGDGRACDTYTGSFTIFQLGLAANGSLDTLNATFEEHCEGGVAGARGRVLINVAGPPAMADGVSVAATGTVSTAGLRDEQLSLVTVHGTATCDQPVQLTITGTVPQTGAPPTPPLSGAVVCTPGTIVAWTASGWVPPLNPANVVVAVTASGLDPYYFTILDTTGSASVQLVTPPPRIYPRRPPL